MEKDEILPEDHSSKPQYTGRRLVMMEPGSSNKNISDAANKVSLRLAFSSDYKNHEEDYANAFDEADGIVFEKFGIAVINDHHEGEIGELTNAPLARRVFLYDEPERYLYTLNSNPLANMGRSLWGFICSIFGLRNDRNPISDPVNPHPISLPDSFSDNSDSYWGIQSIGFQNKSYSGKGVKLAILDTGINEIHPDFTDREVVSKSFIANEKVNDLNGHGTHCTGIAAGYTQGENGIRYGVANKASIYVGKVLSNAGRGPDSGILAGMEWAMRNGCKIISMSLGSFMRPGHTYSRIYNDVAKIALDQGTLIIAAAGNDSRRSQKIIQAVNHPANCPNIMAVAAIDRFLKVADFSCGSVNKDDGQLVDIAGPGVAVFSSSKSPENYIWDSGTSMATPFVAGVAALLWEIHPKATPYEIWDMLKDQARSLPLSIDDVGAGLVQVPR
ncbi:S8 family serine peptidase [Lunatibacter salilacus]|uniref:S8 family serine peptidase n=1 Tax=Lunatibacter salilacus TaxID=2483804 RepID=UPI00131E2013|nr:S8 family serine peptidase [Lunatibacter salilacus]